MQNQTSTELKSAQTILKKLDAALATLMQNQAIKAWNNIVIPENEELIFFFGVRNDAQLHSQVGGKKMPKLIAAQIAFRLHTTSKSREDIYQTITSIRRTINNIANAMAMNDDSPKVTQQIKKETAEHQAKTEYLLLAGKLLQSVYLNINQFSILDMVSLIRQRGSAGTKAETDFLENGIRLFTFFEDKSSDPDQQQLLPISTCMEKADALLQTLGQYPNTCEELTANTSHLVLAVINDRFIAPVAQVLQKIKGNLHSKEGMIDKLTTPVKDEFSKLNRTDNPANFIEQFKEIEKTTNRVRISLIDLGRKKDFLTIIDTSNAIINEATAFSSWLRKMNDDLEDEFRRPTSTLNIPHTANYIRSKYYTGGLIAMVKHFFGKRLETDLISKILKTCPVLPTKGNKGNIKEMKDTTTLNNFLRKHLHEYEKTINYTDINNTIRQGITDYAKILTASIAALPLNSSTQKDYYDCGALLKQLTDPSRLK